MSNATNTVPTARFTKVAQITSHPNATTARSYQRTLGEAGRPATRLLDHVQRQEAGNTRRVAEQARLKALRASQTAGAKFERGRDLTLVAKDLRRDIRAEIKANRLPKGLKVSVRIERYSMGQSLHLAVTAAPGLSVGQCERSSLREQLEEWPTPKNQTAGI